MDPVAAGGFIVWFFIFIVFAVIAGIVAATKNRSAFG